MQKSLASKSQPTCGKESGKKPFLIRCHQRNTVGEFCEAINEKITTLDCDSLALASTHCLQSRICCDDVFCDAALAENSHPSCCRNRSAETDRLVVRNVKRGSRRSERGWSRRPTSLANSCPCRPSVEARVRRPVARHAANAWRSARAQCVLRERGLKPAMVRTCRGRFSNSGRALHAERPVVRRLGQSKLLNPAFRPKTCGNASR